MPELFNPIDYAVPAFIILIVAEMLWARRRAPEKYEPRDTLTSLALGTGSTVAGALSGALVFSLAMWIYEQRFFDIGWVWWAWPLCFVLDDLAYYWAHRSGHRVRWFWASHVNHHSSQHYNLSTATPNMDWLYRAWLYLPHTFGIFGFSSRDAVVRRRVQSHLSILDPHRGNLQIPALGRICHEHAQPSPRPPCDQPALSRPELRRDLHHLGPHLRNLYRGSRRRKDPLWHRQAIGHVQPVVERVS